MFLTRWKMMAGVLGVSLGGLAAMAGQCTKSDPAKGAPPPEMPVASAPATAPVMSPPTVPSLPPIPTADSGKAPAMLPVIPAGATVPPVGGPVGPAIPTPPAVIPFEAPAVPPMAGKLEPMLPPPAPSELLPVPAGSTLPTPPASTTVIGPGSLTIPADSLVDAPAAPITITKPAATAPAGVITAVAETKYRILLRVGEGEPTFEVRCADNLILKVVCEKVDVKSPEKGHGLSSVRAAGKVRFAGFGAEGTCDELQFLAGTGEVGMTGHVKVQVKDKLGRVESELSAETLRYRIDPHTPTGNGLLKP